MTIDTPGAGVDDAGALEHRKLAGGLDHRTLSHPQNALQELDDVRAVSSRRAGLSPARRATVRIAPSTGLPTDR